MNKNTSKTLIFYALLICAFFLAMQYIARSNALSELSYSEMVQLFEQEQVTKFTVKDDVVSLTLADGSTTSTVAAVVNNSNARAQAIDALVAAAGEYACFSGVFAGCCTDGFFWDAGADCAASLFAGEVCFFFDAAVS